MTDHVKRCDTCGSGVSPSNHITLCKIEKDESNFYSFCNYRCLAGFAINENIKETNQKES